MTPRITFDPIDAADALTRGDVVAFPTETVYGLGAHIGHPDAVARIFSIKGRPQDHPLIVHGADARLLDRYGSHVGDDAYLLAESFWPGPLTIIVTRNSEVPDVVTGGQSTVGLRVPDHILAREMLLAVDAGVAAPSANLFGRISPTTAAHVAHDLAGAIPLILDGGASEVGVESTIIDLTADTPAVLRLGGITAETLAAVLGKDVSGTPTGPARAPGMLAAHYAPRATLRIATTQTLASVISEYDLATARVAVLGTPDAATVPAGVLSLTPRGTSASDFAHDLYRLMRAADDADTTALIVLPPQGAGIAAAVRDRLERAAQGHS
jgi:L-threonylcarbamoyladenylate synthase